MEQKNPVQVVFMADKRDLALMMTTILQVTGTISQLLLTVGKTLCFLPKSEVVAEISISLCCKVPVMGL